MLIELIDIHAGYNSREILKGTTLEVDKGEIVALLGHNGTGKSTILKTIAGLISPKKGKIIFDGVDITTLKTDKRIFMEMGYFLQGGEIFNDMSIFENLEMGGANLNKRIFRERLDDVLNLFPSLKNKFNKRAGLLSGGERQMLALGMIILNKPKLLLLDEPSAGLSPLLVKDIMEKIVEINKIYGTAILLVEQKINEALNIAGRGYILTNGQVEFKGNAEELREELKKRVNIKRILF